MEEFESVAEGGRQLSRRTLIKGGAVAGGLIWAAPAIDSFLSPAAAASGAGLACSYALFVFTVGGTQYAAKFTQGSTACTDTNTDGSYKDSTVGTCGGTTYAINSTNEITANGTVIPTYPLGCATLFTVNGQTISWNSSVVTVDAILVHDGSFGLSSTPPLGEFLCSPSEPWTEPNTCNGSNT